MREIKFRAWQKAHKKMHYSVNLYSMGRDQMTRAQLDSKSFMDTIGLSCEIMQATGLKDKNGKDIYEGDILHCHEYDSSDCGHRIVQTFPNAVVGYNAGAFYYHPKGNMRQPHQLLMYAYKPEVIGNIYENPELLTP